MVLGLKKKKKIRNITQCISGEKIIPILSGYVNSKKSIVIFIFTCKLDKFFSTESLSISFDVELRMRNKEDNP